MNPAPLDAFSLLLTGLNVQFPVPRHKMMAHHHGETQITFCVRGVISPLLSNIYLNEVDRMLERAKEITRKGKYTYVEYARFAESMPIRAMRGCSGR